MSYMVSVHYVGGSMGEAVWSHGNVVVSTEAEANSVADAINNHPAAQNGWALVPVITEIPEILSEEKAVETMLSTNYIAEYED